MSRPVSKEKITDGEHNAKIKSGARDKSFLRKPNKAYSAGAKGHAAD
jgi:hypothetical protein